MIPAAMAVAAAGLESVDRAAFAREARVARLAALVLDTIVFGLITGIVNGVYGVTEVTSGYISATGSFYSTTTAVAWPWLTLLGLIYFTIPEAMFGASPGKQWMRLKVVRLDGRPLAIRGVLIRNVLKPIDFLPVFYLLGGILVLATPGAQRLGDLLGGTTVVYRHRALEPGATRTSRTATLRALIAVLAAAVVFTALFDYFGRPALIIQGMFNTGELPPDGITTYTLSNPRWGVGTVTYSVVTRRSPDNGCVGKIVLQWNLFGWQQSSSSFDCRPGLK